MQILMFSIQKRFVCPIYITQIYFLIIKYNKTKMQGNYVTIDLSFIDLAQYKNSIDLIRTQIEQRRKINPILPVTYRAIMPMTRQSETNKNVLLPYGTQVEVQLDSKNLYPNSMTRLDTNGDVRIQLPYTRQFCASHALGILVAEQIRFSTLQASLLALKGKDVYGIFDYFFDEFKGSVYNDWASHKKDYKFQKWNGQVKVLLEKMN